MSDAADFSNTRNVGLPILGASAREKDPVCGMTVDPGKAAAKQDLRGTTYYFCSRGCAARFAKEPEKFLAVPGSSGMAPHSGGAAPHGDPARRAASAGGALAGKMPTMLQSGAETNQIAAEKSAYYTCPMHPQILQIGPV